MPRIRKGMRVWNRQSPFYKGKGNAIVLEIIDGFWDHLPKVRVRTDRNRTEVWMLNNTFPAEKQK